jgi:hypothetical protein
MEEFQIDKNLAFLRATKLLETRISSPSYLLALWKVTGNFKGRCPDPERLQPWFQGIEQYINY